MNELIIDLHCHSTNSDGTWSVREILTDAEAKGIYALSITDHDNLQGSKEAFEIHKGIYSGILIPGIEISTRVLGKKIHMLAYFPSVNFPDDAPVLQSLTKIRDSRVWRMKEMIKRAVNLGFDVTFEEVLEIAGTGISGDEQPTDVVSRPHLARALLNKGYVKDFAEAFDKYLADGKPLHVERFTLKFEEWVDQVKQQDGIMVWAHPLHGHEENKESFLEVANFMKNSGIHGVERVYNYKGKYTISDDFEKWGEEQLDRILENTSWIITAGGDFHGDVGNLGGLKLSKDRWNNIHKTLFP